MNALTWEISLFRRAHEALESHVQAHPVLAEQSLLQQGYAYCSAITREHSRTFYLASSLLPADMRRAVRALYAFCRVSDDLVDREAANRLSDLAQWRQLNLEDSPPDGDLVAMAWADTRATFGIPRRYAEQLLDGVELDLTTKRYETFDELAHYCYGVASTVGLMTMHIVGFTGNEAIPYAVKLGVALQLTNILRDVGEDWSLGRFYLPQEELRGFNLSEADIAAGNTDRRWRDFMRFQIQRTRQLYAEAMPGIVLLGKEGQLAIAAAAELYKGILGNIEEHRYDVFRRRAYLGSFQKLRQLPGIWWRTRTKAYGELRQPPWADH